MKRFASMALAAAVPFAAAAATTPVVMLWAPERISSDRFESHPAFDPRNGDLYFVRSSPKFEGWRIFASRCGASGWSEPVSAAFAGDGVEADPWFTADGSRLYFISSRTTDGIKRKGMDLWQVDRDANGHWGEPQRLPEPVNSSGNEWFPRLARDGWLYFGSDRPGGLGRTDIWRAREQNGRWTVENAGAALNTAADEYEPLPSPDGKTMILMAGDGLYRSERTAAGWSKRVKLPAQVNVNGSEIGAAFSPSGRTLLFARDTKGPRSGELFVWHIAGNEAWPRACPVLAKRSR
ncbi:hypothetical protein FCE95_01610 [Luteimonas gilva]|uniref:Uncharacterized protein n=1 Tax=Luteimonas gilva TaxID=2572684 RepID=A0A4U5JT98_9GAMM|nr:PD40 domain-containing protein [Luteimonas gilva]TKR33042.1 hypothetical protein FCE95_01610 [Luteimonas gilva]